MITLVTGATGLVGNNVVRLLLERNQPVRVMVRAGSDPRPLEGLEVETAFGDIRDAESVFRAMEGVGQVVHAAALVKVGWSDLELMRRINVEGTRHVAEAARRQAARLVHVSSCDACGIGTAEQPADEETAEQGDVPTPYVLTKRESEAVILEQVAEGLQAAIVNPAFMLGPWDWKPSSGQMLVEVGSGRGWLAPRGSMSVCDVRDVAAGTLAALERGQPGRRYILAGENMTYLEAWRLFAEVTGAWRPLGAVPPLLAALAGRGGDLWGKIRGREPVVNSGAIQMARLPKNYSSARAERELDYRCRPARESVADAWKWFREHGYVK